MRVTEKDELIMWSYDDNQVVWHNSDSGTNGVYKGKHFSRSDVIKNEKQPSGWRAPSAYRATDLQHSYLSGESTLLWKRYTSEQWVQCTFHTSGALDRSFGPESLPVNTYGSNAESALIVKALSELKDQKANYALIVAELTKSVGLIASTALTLLNAVTAVKRRKFAQAAAILGIKNPIKNSKGLANDWLAFVYGWKPLLGDMYGAYQQITSLDQLEGAMLVTRAHFVNESESGSNLGTAYSAGDPSTIYNCRGVIKHKQSIKIALWYTLDLPGLQRAAQGGLVNPLAVAWELTPWSFLADWLVPIGSVLDALDATVGLKFLGGSCTRYSLATQTVSGLAVGTTKGAPENRQALFGSCEGSARRMEMDRKVYNSSPIPTPFVKNPFSGQHAANAVALLRTNLR